MRLRHVDRMRAIAVLCMVEVHTAAILPPKGITVGHPAAFVAAAFGGMAAPMFVTISGWGMYHSARRRDDEGYSSADWMRWLLPRVSVLVLCQLLVNLLLNVERGGRFEWHTPGVLTLLAIAAILAPLLVRMSIAHRAALMLLMGISPLLLGNATSPDLGWYERVDADGVSEWISRLLWNGTYPVLPWLFYVFLGTVIHDLGNQPRIRERNIAIGLLATTATVFVAVVEEVDWALTSGEAVLTFFPASMPFLIVSGTMVILTMRLLEGEEATGGDPSTGERLAFLEPAGRLSLTIYVAHFAVLGVAAIAIDGARLDVVPAFAVTIGHTLAWIPIAVAHERYTPNLSFESLLGRLSQSGR